MVDLNGHEAGNGGHSQGNTYSLSGLLYSERRDISPRTISELRRKVAAGSCERLGRVRRYRRVDFLVAMPFRAAFAFFCFSLGFGVELARIVSAFDASVSDSSYASRSQSVRGASTSSRCLI